MEGIKLPEFVETVSPHVASVKARQPPQRKSRKEPANGSDFGDVRVRF